MLDKIKSLGLNVNNSQSNRYYSVYERNKITEHKSAENYDTMQRSEALEYLYQLDWHIKAINFLNESKLTVTFEVSGIDFRTVFDLSDRVKGEIEYSLSMVNSENDLLTKLTTALSLTINSGYNSAVYYSFEMEGLKLLFKRLFDLKISSELSVNDSGSLDGLFLDIFPDVYKELYHITNNLFLFIYKLTGTKVFISQAPSNPSINISHIKVTVIN
jgi:hypothetical protein